MLTGVLFVFLCDLFGAVCYFVLGLWFYEFALLCYLVGFFMIGFVGLICLFCLGCFRVLLDSCFSGFLFLLILIVL